MVSMSSLREENGTAGVEDPVPSSFSSFSVDAGDEDWSLVGIIVRITSPSNHCPTPPPPSYYTRCVTMVKLCFGRNVVFVYFSGRVIGVTSKKSQ